MSDYMDDLYNERFGKSRWWKTPPSEPTNYPQRALLEAAERDDALTIARRRRVLAEAYDETAEETA